MPQIPPYFVNDGRKDPYSQQEWQRQIRDTKFMQLLKNVEGSISVNLTTDETSNQVLTFTGALGANINVIVAPIIIQWSVYNNTTGAFTLTVKTPNGSGIAVGQGKHAILRGDGTNVLRVTADI
jgi:hypothetical protein